MVDDKAVFTTKGPRHPEVPSRSRPASLHDPFVNRIFLGNRSVGTIEHNATSWCLGVLVVKKVGVLLKRGGG